MKQVIRIVLLSLILGMEPGRINGMIDDRGVESTQYLLDYETLEKTYFDFDTYEELSAYCRKNLKLEYNFINDETGIMIEWNIGNAIFINLANNGDDSIVRDGYEWDVGTGFLPSTYEYFENSSIMTMEMLV